jgi:hypothetical protein
MLSAEDTHYLVYVTVRMSAGVNKRIEVANTTDSSAAVTIYAKCREPAAQAQFAQAMRSGQADAEPGELDWQRIVDNWHLPEPRGRARR